MTIQSALISPETDYEQEAVEWLQENLPLGQALVCTSGGKDSIVTTEIARMAGVSFELQSTLTGIDPPQVTRFIRRNYPDCSFVRPRQSFWHLITTANPPGGTGRGIKWCCTKIKEAPSNQNPIRNRILGIRAEESSARSKYERINNVGSQSLYYPIFNWKEWQIWEFIERHKLPYPDLYDQGLDRIGCVVCPNHYGRHGFYRQRWPRHFDCFEKYVHIWWHKRKGQGKKMYHSLPEQFLHDWYAGKFYYYEHVKKEDRQMELFKEAQQ